MRQHGITQQELAEAIGFKHASQVYFFVHQGRIPKGLNREQIIERIKAFLKEKNIEVSNLSDSRLVMTRQRFYLKKIMLDYEIPYIAFLEHLPGFTKADLSTIINNCRFPHKAQEEIIRKKVKEVLRGLNVPEDEVNKCWSTWNEDVIPFYFGKDKVEKTVEYKILNKGVAMLTEAVLAKTGLKKDPFRNEMEDIQDVFRCTQNEEVFQKMMDAAKNQKFLGVYGAVGSGKSTLKTLLFESLRNDGKYKIAQVMLDQKESTSVSHIQEAIITDLGGMKAPNDKERQARLTQAVLETLYKQGIKPTLVIDESHSIPSLTLKCLKRIWEHQIGFKRLIGIIILGQEEMEAQIRNDIRLREVAARIELVELRPIKNWTILYLKHKIERAGGKIEAIFSPEGLEEIARIMPSATPIEINILASHSIELAYNRGTLPVSAEAVRHAYAFLGQK